MAAPNAIYNYALSVIRRRWIQFLVPCVVILACTAAAVLLWPATYRSSATILVESQQIPGDLVRATVTTLADERIQVIEQRIRARDNLIKIMRKYSLFQDRRTQSNWLQNDVIELMRDRIEIRRQAFATAGRRGSPTIAFKVSFEYESPVTAARVANELVTYILSLDVRTRTSRAAETTKFLDHEKKRLDKALSAIELKISQFKGENKNSLPGALQFNLSMLDGAEQRLRKLESEISQILLQMKLLKSSLETGDVGVASLDGASSSSGSIRAQLQRLKLDLIGKEITFSSSHPEIRRLRKEVAALEAMLDANSSEASKKKGSGSAGAGSSGKSRIESLKQLFLNEKLNDLRARKAELAKGVDELRAHVDNTPQVELSLNSLTREYENLKKEFRIITAKESDAALGEKLEENKQGERFEVIEQATVPRSPVKPNRLMILALGVMAAFGAGGALAGGLEMLDNHIRVSGHLVQQFDIVPMAVIPYVYSRRDAHRAVLTRSVAVGGALAGVAIGLFLVDQYYLPLSLLADKALKFVFIRMG